MTKPHLPSRAGHSLFVITLLIAILAMACKRREAAEPPPSPVATGAPFGATSASTASPAAVETATSTRYDVGGLPLEEGIFVGPAKHYGNLTVFPIVAASQVDVGPLVSLQEALATGTAEVREIGSDPTQAGRGQDANIQATSDPPQPEQRQNQPIQGQEIQRVGHGGAQVNKLVIENRGAVPVYVLAGTIVKGGNQDRQVGQDFIIGAKRTTAIDAFCVEHGRWNGQRNGEATGGKFEAAAQLANRKVRAAGQLKKNQSEVWAEVSKVNAANDTKSASGSLLASVDDAEIREERDALRRRILADLDRVTPAGAVVGYAHAIGGEVEGVRWFANHRIFAMFREVLVNTAVADAITARAEGGRGGADSPAPAVTAAAVARFVADTKRAAATAAAEQRETDADNVNEYVETTKSYRSTTILDRKGAGPPEKTKMSVDYSAL